MNTSRLKQATGANDRETALGLLAQMAPSIPIILPLLSEVMDAAIDSSNLTSIALARDILSAYKAEPEIKSRIQLIATGYLAAHDEWHYRRIAELYALLNYEEELSEFLQLCQASANVEIQEISDDLLRH